MSTERINPYQSPLAKSEPVGNKKPRRVWLPLALVVLAACGYHLFIALLLMSPGGDDQKGGFLFCLNTPVLVIWILGLFRAEGRSFILGFVAVVVQILITGIMIANDIGEFKTVCEINGGIILGLSLLTGICWIFTWLNGVPQTRDENAAGSGLHS